MGTIIESTLESPPKSLLESLLKIATSQRLGTLRGVTSSVNGLEQVFKGGTSIPEDIPRYSIYMPSFSFSLLSISSSMHMVLPISPYYVYRKIIDCIQ
jgi:hypothetical protein